MKISVVMGTYQRAEFLYRSLLTYKLQNMSIDDFELIVIDDWSTDSTEELCTNFSRDMNLIYIKPTYKKPGTWRDSAKIINLGIRAAKGELVLATHPEVMVGKNTLVKAYEEASRNISDLTYFCAKPYYLTPREQELIDTVDWIQSGAGAVRNLPDFYSDAPVITGQPDYRPQTIEAISYWDSWVFGGMRRYQWDYFGGMGEYETWGSIDLDFLARRVALEVSNNTMADFDTYVVHQNHDSLKGTDGETPRVMPNNVPSYTKKTAILHNL